MGQQSFTSRAKTIDSDTVSRTLDALAVATVAARADGTIVHANSALLNLVHPAARIAPGDSLTSLVIDPHKALAWLEACAESRQHIPGEIVWRSESDSAIALRCEGALLEAAEDGAPATLLVTFAPKAPADERSRAAREELEKLLSEIDRERRAHVQAKSEVKARDEFLLATSHELRNPINALHLTLYGIARSIAQSPVSEKLVTRIWAVQRQVERLTRMIDGLLDVSRLVSGRLHLNLEEMDVTALLQELIERCREQPNSPKIEFSNPGPVWGRWDRMRLDEAFTSLLSNAVKFGEGKPVAVILQSDGSLLKLEVADQGIGIALENHSRIFERFERLENARQYGGFGLGLWVTRRIVEALGGAITVSSAPGEGSTFLVDLPILSRN